MIQSTTNAAVQNSPGFGALARFGTQPTKAQESSRSGKASLGGATTLTPEQQQQVAQLRQTDIKVRAHEQAHLSVGADLVRGGPTFSYSTGPDNKRYAVAGEVAIDTTPGRTPEETVPKAQRIRAAALAPAEPSAQDHSVAAQASQMEQQAQLEILAQQHGAAPMGDGGRTEFYRALERSAFDAVQLGSRLDLFA
jgi:hypothetical protein